MEEAHHSSEAINKWLENPASPTLLAEAMDTRSAFVREYIERENVDTSIRNMVPYGIEQDAIFRINLVEELSQMAIHILEELRTSDET